MSPGALPIALPADDVEHDEPLRLREVVIVGGGCYGTFYSRQLLRARDRGRAEFARLIVVDRDSTCQFTREVGAADDRVLRVADWDDFFDTYLGDQSVAGDLADVIVPSPLMPHLMYRWLIRRARARWPHRTIETRGLDAGPGTPYDVAAPDGTRYVSFADWTCPTHCVEPAICPVTGGPRTWEMGDALGELVRRRPAPESLAGPVLFTCRHLVFGVGGFSCAEVRAGDAAVRAAGERGGAVGVVVGTVSSCHGAVNLLHLGPTPA